MTPAAEPASPLDYAAPTRASRLPIPLGLWRCCLAYGALVIVGLGTVNAIAAIAGNGAPLVRSVSRFTDLLVNGQLWLTIRQGDTTDFATVLDVSAALLFLSAGFRYRRQPGESRAAAIGGALLLALAIVGHHGFALVDVAAKVAAQPKVLLAAKSDYAWSFIATLSKLLLFSLLLLGVAWQRMQTAAHRRRLLGVAMIAIGGVQLISGGVSGQFLEEAIAAMRAISPSPEFELSPWQRPVSQRTRAVVGGAIDVAVFLGGVAALLGTRRWRAWASAAAMIWIAVAGIGVAAAAAPTRYTLVDARNLDVGSLAWFALNLAAGIVRALGPMPALLFGCIAIAIARQPLPESEAATPMAVVGSSGVGRAAPTSPIVTL